jgi:hypothetical protein
MEGHGVPLQSWSKSKESEIGLSYKEILRYLSLLNLTPEVQEMVSEALDIAKALKKLYDIMCHGDTKLSLRKFADMIGGTSRSAITAHLNHNNDEVYRGRRV